MAQNSQIVRVTATGDVVAQGKKVGLRSFSLFGTAGAISAIFRDGGAGGTVLFSMHGTTSTVQRSFLDMPISQDGLHVTLAGTGAEVTCEVSLLT